jgi:hypothetical protein
MMGISKPEKDDENPCLRAPWVKERKCLYCPEMFWKNKPQENSLCWALEGEGDGMSFSRV